MDLTFGMLAGPSDQDALDGLAAASAEANRVLDEQWGQLVGAFFACNWFGGDRQAFNDRYMAVKEQVERLRGDLAVTSARVTEATDEGVHQAIAFGFAPGAGLAWTVIDRIVD